MNTFDNPRIIRGNRSFKRDNYLPRMRFIKLLTILVVEEYLAKMNNLPKAIARGPLGRGAQCNRIGCIGLRPACLESKKIESLQVHIGYLTFSLKKSWIRYYLQARMDFEKGHPLNYRLTQYTTTVSIIYIRSK